MPVPDLIGTLFLFAFWFLILFMLWFMFQRLRPTLVEAQRFLRQAWFATVGMFLFIAAATLLVMWDVNMGSDPVRKGLEPLLILPAGFGAWLIGAHLLSLPYTLRCAQLLAQHPAEAAALPRTNRLLLLVNMTLGYPLYAVVFRRMKLEQRALRSALWTGTSGVKLAD